MTISPRRNTSFRQHLSRSGKQSLTLTSFLQRGLLWPAEEPVTSLQKNQTKRGRRPYPSRSFPYASDFITPFGVDAIDSHLPYGGLLSGVIHEWFLAQRKDMPDNPLTNQILTPLSLLTFLVGNAISELIKDRGVYFDSQHDALLNQEAYSIKNKCQSLLKWNRYIFWIGKECWPSPYALCKNLPLASLMNSCIFIDARDDAEKLSFLDIILRSPATFAVVAYLKNLSIAESKRLTIAAASHDASNGRIAFICRPVSAVRTLSTSQTRWRLTPIAADSLITGTAPNLPPLAWKLELIKQKGLQAKIRNWKLLLRENISTQQKPLLTAFPLIKTDTSTEPYDTADTPATDTSATDTSATGKATSFISLPSPSRMVS